MRESARQIASLAAIGIMSIVLIPAMVGPEGEPSAVAVQAALAISIADAGTPTELSSETASATSSPTPSPSSTSLPTQANLWRWPEGPLEGTDAPGWYVLADHPVPWTVDCDNDVAWDGYRDRGLMGYCTPGVLSAETLSRRLPPDHWGALSSYADGVMERIEDARGVGRGRGVAVMSCNQIGYTVWLRVPGVHATWQGPFTVVDCSAPQHTFFHMAGIGLAAEIGYTRAQQWGVRAAARVDVHIGSSPPPPGWTGLNLSQWWIDHALSWEDGFSVWGGPRGTPTPTPWPD